MESSLEERHNRAEKQKMREKLERKASAFKRILGLGVIVKFLEVEETSPPLCNLNFPSKTSSWC